MSVLLILVVILFKHVVDRNVIDGLLTVAGYTYGPLWVYLLLEYLQTTLLKTNGFGL